MKLPDIPGFAVVDPTLSYRYSIVNVAAVQDPLPRIESTLGCLPTVNDIDRQRKFRERNQASPERWDLMAARQRKTRIHLLQKSIG